MNHSTILICAALATLVTAGCDTAINAKAAQLGNDISLFRDNQSKRLEEINDKFDQSYKDSITMLQTAKKQELRLDRDRDAQRIADQIVANRANSLRSTFRDNLAQIVITERSRISEADQSIEDARESFSKGYQKASLTLEKLDAVIANLNLLGQSHKNWKDYYKMISAVQKVYQGLQSKAATPEPGPVDKTPSRDPAIGVAPVSRSANQLQIETKAAGSLAQ